MLPKIYMPNMQMCKHLILCCSCFEDILIFLLSRTFCDVFGICRAYKTSYGNTLQVGYTYRKTDGQTMGNA